MEFNNWMVFGALALAALAIYVLSKRQEPTPTPTPQIVQVQSPPVVVAERYPYARRWDYLWNRRYDGRYPYRPGWRWRASTPMQTVDTAAQIYP